jgi:C4-dicarboxylate-specific signal transduction histidine kinase
VPFVDELTRALERERLSILDELGGVRHGVEHIGELVRSQQSLAGRHGVLEPVDVRELLDSAAMICLPSGRSADEVYVVREYDEMPIVELDRHKLMEVLVNLVKNALEAMAAERDKTLTLRASLEGERVRLEIGDNGCGLDDVTSIFAHGVSNKSGGRGYGLHVSANSTTEMGGSLRAESAGLGHGATFALELPARIHPAQAVA